MVRLASCLLFVVYRFSRTALAKMCRSPLCQLVISNNLHRSHPNKPARVEGQHLAMIHWKRKAEFRENTGSRIIDVDP